MYLFIVFLWVTSAKVINYHWEKVDLPETGMVEILQVGVSCQLDSGFMALFIRSAQGVSSMKRRKVRVIDLAVNCLYQHQCWTIIDFSS